MDLEVFQGIAEEKYPQPTHGEIIESVMEDRDSPVAARRNKIAGFLDGVKHVMSTMSPDMSDYYNRVMKLKFNYREEAKNNFILNEAVKDMRTVLTTWICHKGCGVVQLELNGNDLTCGTCGEELEDMMTIQFIKEAKKELREV
jgi:hypothetical protein